MDLGIKDQLFLVGGATSGFGRAVAEALAAEGAHVIAVARSAEQLKMLQEKHKRQVETICCDITLQDAANQIVEVVGDRQLHGVLVNAGGPPAKTVLETTLEDWDNAYRTVLRWKIHLTQTLVPKMMKAKYGRFLYIESASVKQPMENLVLSNSMRLAVIGYIKTLSREVGKHGITFNVMAPGFHLTAAMERIFKKKTEQTGITKEAAMPEYIGQTSVGFMGNAEDFASLATWLFSPHSRYLTGQTISVDGGMIRGIMG